MELIVLSRGRRIQRALHLRGMSLTLIGVVGCLMLAGAVWLGTRLAPPPAPTDPRADLLAAAMSKEVATLRDRLEDASGTARHDLDALALRLSELKAQAIRLDALGGRLVDLADLDAGEFSFGQPPPRGGPAPSEDGVQPNTVSDFLTTMRDLDELLTLRAQELEALENNLLYGRLARELQPRGSPVSLGWMSSGFGQRLDPITGQRSMHMGVDFAGKRGSPIKAVAAGIVSFSGTRSGLGRMVELDHGNGYTTRYAHNLKNLVKLGQRVAKGDTIATMGSSGRATGTHVHFEVLREGRHLNPMKFIRESAPAS